MKIHTLIVDDDPHWRLVFEKFAGVNPLIEVVGSCDSAVEAYGLLMEKEIDLLICDIEMPEMSGLEFVKSLKSPPLVIFVTAHRDYALDCYEVAPIDFLLKPSDLPRFLKAIEKVRLHLDTAPETSAISPYFFIRDSNGYVQVRYNDILYMEAKNNTIHIVAKDDTYTPTLTLSKLEEKLKSDIFLRVHRSFLVHREAIARINKNEIVLTDGTEIPIGDQYRNKINQKHIESYRVLRG
ncbi:LytR/AlgR family response regulator transcription factor [Runella sp.]|uniref:LytR/AlgR family response regulator transcription factor n=1 Tax=Runella sp. TaxID=1960881 RepID=UPI003D103780